MNRNMLQAGYLYKNGYLSGPSYDRSLQVKSLIHQLNDRPAIDLLIGYMCDALQQIVAQHDPN